MNRNTTTHPALANTVRSATVALLVVLASIVFAGDAQAILLEGLDANGGHALTADGVHYVSYFAPSSVSSADDIITAAVLSSTSLRGGPQER